MAKTRPTKQIRELLARPGIIRSMGAHDVMSALIMEKAGFESVFIGGFGTSASLCGLPDLNFLGMTEMADAVRRMAASLRVPLIADGDTGYGDLHNVGRTVREFETAGAAGMILEDQVFPKRCGHFEGKAVIPTEQMVAKFKAAVRAREDDDFLFIARTDARAPVGLDEAIDRVNRYCDAGADVAFVEAPESLDELEIISRRVEAPKLINMLSFGKTPVLSAADLEAMGYKSVVSPIAALLVTVKAVQKLAHAYLTHGHAKNCYGDMVSFDEVKELLGLSGFLSRSDEITTS